MDWIGDQGPGNAPPGWGQQFGAGGIGSAELVEVLNCGRVSWGPFERPMTILFESHDKIDVPAPCATELFTWMLNSVWVSDHEFATFLSFEYKLTTHFALFTFENTIENGVGQMTWTWNTVDGLESDLTVVSPVVEPQQPQFTLAFRYAWDSGGGISFAYMNETMIVPAAPEQLALGNFRAPMMHSSAGTEHFAGRGDYVIGVNATNAIVEFGDYSCGSRL